METVIERILGHPLLTVALLLLCVLMLYALFKRLLKMLAYLAVAVTATSDAHFLEKEYPLPELGIADEWKETVLPLLPGDWNRTFLDGNFSGLSEWPGQKEPQVD